MIKMFNTPGGTICQNEGKLFVNNRLISLLEDLMIQYAEMRDNSYVKKIACPPSAEKPLHEIIDLDRLSKDERFVTEWLESFSLIPQTVGPQRALYDFFSLYRLLKARKEIKPSLTMEYILYHLIEMEKDLCLDMPEIHESRKQIAESIRSQMMPELMKKAAELRERDLEAFDETVPEIAEELMAYYEDLDKYGQTCFEDMDCLLLDEMDEEAVEESGFAERHGINVAGDEATVTIQGFGKFHEFSVPAWELC